jgi:hypothetical protein
LVSTLSFLTVHIKVASAGVTAYDISFPCKHNPASNLKESLDPNPAGLTFSFDNNKSQNLTISPSFTDISKPSSPIIIIFMYINHS